MSELVPTKMGTPRRWRLVHPVRPWTVAAEAKMPPDHLDEIVRVWRHSFCVLARVGRLPGLGLITVTALPVLALEGTRQRRGAGACFGAVTAALGGLVDAGVIDGIESVVALHLLEAAVGDRGQLILIVSEAGQLP
jgi:hypothetical protein